MSTSTVTTTYNLTSNCFPQLVLTTVSQKGRKSEGSTSISCLKSMEKGQMRIVRAGTSQWMVTHRVPLWGRDLNPSSQRIVSRIIFQLWQMIRNACWIKWEGRIWLHSQICLKRIMRCLCRRILHCKSRKRGGLRHSII